MIKEKLKKYRAVGVIAGAMVFNLVESLIFAKNGNAFNLEPMSTGEWICDIIAGLIFFFGVMMMYYDLWSYKPRKTITYKKVNGEVTEIIVVE